MSLKLPYLSKSTLNDMQCAIYSYNVDGNPDLFINTFTLEQLGGLNKVYNASIEQIVKRIIHNEDQSHGLKSIDLIKKDSSQLYIHFRRTLVKNSDYLWTFVVTGASEINEDNSTKRILTYAKTLTSEHDEIFQCMKNIELIGFNISQKTLAKQLGIELSTKTFEIYATPDFEDRKSKILEIEIELRDKLNIPDFWTTEMMINFLGAIQIKQPINA